MTDVDETLAESFPASDPPATYSIARNGTPFSVPASNTCTMFGCCSRASASASLRNRATASAVRPSSSVSTL